MTDRICSKTTCSSAADLLRPVLIAALLLCMTACRNAPVQEAATGSIPAATGTSYPFKTVCAGADHSAFHVIFLQGIMSAEQQTDYVALLDETGKKLGIRFAIPYSNMLCQNSENRYCWGTGEPDSVANVYKKIRDSAASCFSLDEPWGLLGFSNGGYHVGRVIAQGHKPVPAWAIAVGSAGSSATINPVSTSRKIPFYITIGTEDITRQNALLFSTELEKYGFDARYQEFQGGHELTGETLQSLLKNVL